MQGDMGARRGCEIDRELAVEQVGDRLGSRDDGASGRRVGELGEGEAELGFRGDVGGWVGGFGNVASLLPMGIIGRAQAVLASNFNALISRFEEPGRDIASLLTEMKEQVQLAQRELIRVMGDKKRSEATLAELDEQVSVWEKRAELAVRQGDDGLAREALVQKQRLMAERERVGAARAEQQHAAIGMKAEIDRMQRTHRDYSSRQHTIATQLSQSRAGSGALGLGAAPGVSNFDAFDRIERSVESAAAETDAAGEVERMLDQTALGTMSRAELDQRFHELERDLGQNTSPAAEADTTRRPSPSDGGEGNDTPRIRIKP
jgi:phage shock protein A